MGTHRKRLQDALLTSTHNIRFREELLHCYLLKCLIWGNIPDVYISHTTLLSTAFGKSFIYLFIYFFFFFARH